MSQVTIWRPFGELDLGDQLRLEPHAVFHLFLDQNPLRPFLLGQIGKRAGADSGFPSGLQNKLRILLQQRSAISLIGRKDCLMAPGILALVISWQRHDLLNQPRKVISVCL